MKKPVLLFVVALFCIIASAGCSKNVTDGPLGVNMILATSTPTATPDAGYRVFVTEAGVPVAGVAVQMAPEGVTVPASALTGAKGTADFPVHSGGKWNLTLPSPLGYETLNYTVEPLSNTFFAVELGKQELQVELISGSESLPISPSTLIYRVTYKAGASKLYNLALTGLPTDIVPEMTSTQVRNNNDVAFITLNFPKSYEGLTNATVKVVGTAASGGQVIESAARNVVKGWGFGVSAEMKLLKVYLADNYNDHSPGEHPDESYTRYYLGIKNYYYDAQNFVIDGVVKVEYLSHSFLGEAAVPTSWGLTQDDMPCNQGKYDKTIWAVTDGNYD